MGSQTVQAGRTEAYIERRWIEYKGFQERQEQEMAREIRQILKGYWRNVNRRLNEISGMQTKGFEDFILPSRERVVEGIYTRTKKIGILCLEFGAKREIRDIGGEIEEKALIVVDWNLLMKEVLDEIRKWKSIVEEWVNTIENDLRDIFRKGAEGGWNIMKLKEEVERIMRPYFNPGHEGWKALRIARTETARLICKGELLALKRAGVEKKKWVTAGDEVTCDECVVLGRHEPVLINETFGDYDAPPAHPNCRCDIIGVIEEASETQKESEEEKEEEIDWDKITTIDELRKISEKYILEDGGIFEVGNDIDVEVFKKEIKALYEQVKIWGVKINSLRTTDVGEAFGRCYLFRGHIEFSKKLYKKGMREELLRLYRQSIDTHSSRTRYFGSTASHEYMHHLMSKFAEKVAQERRLLKAFVYEDYLIEFKNRLVEVARKEIGLRNEQKLRMVLGGKYANASIHEVMTTVYNSYLSGAYKELGWHQIEREVENIYREMAEKINGRPEQTISGLRKEQERVRKEENVLINKKIEEIIL